MNTALSLGSRRVLPGFPVVTGSHFHPLGAQGRSVAHSEVQGLQCSRMSTMLLLCPIVIIMMMI